MREPVRLRSMLLAISLAGLLAGCSDGGGADTLPATSFDDQWNLSSTGSRELNFEMLAGGAITFEVNASAEVRYDLHSHAENGTTTYHERGRGRTWSGSFAAPEADVYSIFVAGNGSTSIVKIHVEGAFRLKE